MYRAVVTAIDDAGLYVRIADMGVVGPLPWVGPMSPAEGDSVLVADAGDASQPDLIVLGAVGLSMPE